MHITHPTLLLDAERARRNLDRMLAKAKASGVRFRPHFKSHQSAQIGEWFRERGVTAITVSSLHMARYFAEHGWQDITVAFPANIREIDTMNALAGQIRLNLLLEAGEVVEFLAKNLAAPVGAWLKIDAGYGRTGVPWQDPEQVLALARAVHKARNLQFAGLLTHAGHTYHAASPQQIRDIYQESLQRLQGLRDRLLAAGLGPVAISVGDTPGCSLVDAFHGVDEIRPGNFVFYDAMQWQLGTCAEQDIAVAVACPVVARHAERREIVIYGGAIHLSKDYLAGPDGEKVFGFVAPLHEKGWGMADAGSFVASLSQEHGIIKASQELLESARIGDLLAILPVHSCLTANLLQHYVTLEGERIDMMRDTLAKT